MTGRSRTLSYLAPLLDRLKNDRTATVLLVTPARPAAEKVMLLGHALRAMAQGLLNFCHLFSFSPSEFGEL